MSTCTATVTVADNIPPVATCKDITTTISTGNVGVNLVPYASLVTASDNCSGIAPIFGSITVGCNDIGTNPVVITVRESLGSLSSRCTATVTVRENTPPVAKCKSATVYLNAGGWVSNLKPEIDNGSSDNCGIASHSVSPGTLTCSALGAPQTVTLGIGDASGNQHSCTATVTVLDTVSPSVLCPSNRTLYTGNLNPNCTATYSIPDAVSDNCPGASWGVSFSGNTNGLPADLSGISEGSPSGNVSYELGTTTVTLSATDASGNTATACSFTVTVEDNTVPILICPPNQVLQTNEEDCLAQFIIADPLSDNCSGATWGAIFSGSNPTTSILAPPISGIADGSNSNEITLLRGITTVTLNGVDASNNLAATCSFTVTVNDNTPPQITCSSNKIVNTDPGQCSASVNYTVNRSDNCSNLISIGKIETFSKGVTVKHFDAIDAAGNTNTCSFSITVLDAENPTITCPQQINVENDNEQCGAVVNYVITSDDNCPGVNHAQSDATGLTSGNEFPVGTTTLSYTATDAAGNTTSCTFDVTVRDTQKPDIACPGPITQDSESGKCEAGVLYNFLTGDNCPPPMFQSYGLQSSGGNYPVGTTTQTLQVTDAYGNTASCSFDITIIDVEAPVITCPTDITVDNDPGECGAVVSYSITSSDNCSSTNLQIDASGFSSEDQFPVGTTTQTYEATDPAGNTDACTFTVTVNDVEAPVFVECPADTVIENYAGTCAKGFNYTVRWEDNCTRGGSVSEGTIYPVGVTPISYTRGDASGNTPTCSFTITVIDTEDPVFACPTANVVRNTDAGVCDHLAVSADLDPTVSDNCGLQTVVNDYNNANSLDGAVFPKGKTLVTWTATDIHGNSSVCSYHIKIRDREAPVFDNCPAGTTLVVPAYTPGAYHTWPTLTATDNCNPSHKLTISGFPLSGSYFPVGTTTVNWTVTDKSNNDAPCQFDVTVVETGDPAPNGWTGNSVGNSNSCHTNYNSTSKTLTIQSTGGNVSMNTDNFCGMTIPNSSGIIDFRARVTPAGAGYYDQAGIMMRQSLANNAKHATLLLTGTSVPMMSLRASAGGFPLSTSGTAVTTPYWLRLYRAGGTITGYVSADGVNWSQIMTYPNLLSSPLYLVLFSTTSGASGQATFDDITINGAAARLGDEAMGTELRLKAYPNPFSEDLFIDVENALPGETYNVRLSNMLGQRVYGYETGASPEGKIEQRISLEHLLAGTYLLEVSAGVQRKTLKVQKQ